MGLVKKLLIGAGFLAALATGAGCATSSHITPVEKYQNHKAGVERRYNQESEERTNQAREEYGPALERERTQEAEKLSKDLRKNDEQLVKEMVKEAEEKRKYDQKEQELQKRIDGTYSLNQMVTYSNKKQKPNNFRVGVELVTAEQDSERNKPRGRKAVRVEAGYNLGKGWIASGVYEFDSDTQSVTTSDAHVDATNTGHTYGINIGKKFNLGKGVTFEISGEAGKRYQGIRNRGSFYGSGALIKESDTQSLDYWGGKLRLGFDLGDEWEFGVGLGGRRYGGGNTSTTSINAIDELNGSIGVSKSF